MENNEENFEEVTTFDISDTWLSDVYEMQKINTVCISLVVGLLIFIIFSKRF